jgi:hypothetical protein
MVAAYGSGVVQILMKDIRPMRTKTRAMKPRITGSVRKSVSALRAMMLEYGVEVLVRERDMCEIVEAERVRMAVVRCKCVGAILVEVWEMSVVVVFNDLVVRSV